MPGFLRPLTDYGVGNKSVWEGGVGLFVLFGLGLTGGIVAWVSSLNLNKGKSYECTVSFPEACSITVGTPVRLRGIQVGSVLNVQPHLDRVDVLLEVDDENTAIPRNSRIFANQSGLIAEPLVDIMPQHPIPAYQHTPTSPSCEEEGVVLCHRGSMQGEKGVALDDLVYICTRLMRQMDGEGSEALIKAAETVSVAVEDAKPLIEATTRLLAEIEPLLKELREAGIVGHVDALASLARETATDIQELERTVLDEENVGELRKSVGSLTKTLQHVESILGEVSAVSSNSEVHASVRQLIEALSRLVAD